MRKSWDDWLIPHEISLNYMMWACYPNAGLCISDNVPKYYRRKVRSTILLGLTSTTYSQALSHYCLVRVLLSAEFPPWTGTYLTIEPGHSNLRYFVRVDTELSMDT